jgi:hypothetical protein
LAGGKPPPGFHHAQVGIGQPVRALSPPPVYIRRRGALAAQAGLAHSEQVAGRILRFLLL